MPAPRTVYRILLDAYGPQGWWPGDGAFEIALGAILTQNISWKNVTAALSNISAGGLMDPRRLDLLSAEQIAPLIRSTGYYNQKAVKVKCFLEWLRGFDYNLRLLRTADPAELRKELLSIHGIGPETADSILLYAFSVKIFVVDAYTVRIFARLGFLRGNEGYGEIQSLFHRHFKGGVDDYNEFHALIVKHGKDICKKRPLCGKCVLLKHCPAAGAHPG